MILEELRLHNFCLYKGSHVFDLRPTVRNDENCSIILFGGLNGAGKTTILDAVQLALYGSRARCSNRAGRPYEDYLRECINRNAEAHESCSVSIEFKYVAEGQEHRYEVYREWSSRESSIRERVKVAKDNELDPILSEQWNDLVEDLIPLGVSQLFFFDAEKVRFLADNDTDAATLGSAIKSLLGLDLTERLIADAGVVEKKLAESVIDRSSDERVSTLQRQLEEKSAEVSEVATALASLENRRLKADSHLQEVQVNFAAAGGKHWEQRSYVELQLQEAVAAEKDISIELKVLCEGELPFLLVLDQLNGVMQRDSADEDAIRSEELWKATLQRDKRVVKRFQDAGSKIDAVKSLRQILAEDRQTLKRNTPSLPNFGFSAQSRDILMKLLGSTLESLQASARKLLCKREAILASREKNLRLLNAAPEESTIADLVERLRKAATASGLLNGERNRLKERQESLRRERDDLDRSLTEARQKVLDREIAHEESLRLIRLAQRTQATMREFLRRATEHKIDRLSNFVTRSFNYLLRKKKFVSRVQINPGTFQIDLLDENGISIPKGRMSEGEKQVFAISVLWGLAQAAPRELPTIIDTPMARLDSEHRRYMVERYFPNASHQTIILSTDMEIEQSYLEELRPRIARTYHLQYSDSEKSTVAVSGYFWDAPSVISTESRR